MSANVANLLQITGERGNEFQLFTSFKNSFLFRHNYPATSKKGTIDCGAELAFCCVGSDNRLHRHESSSWALTHLKCKLQQRKLCRLSRLTAWAWLSKAFSVASLSTSHTTPESWGLPQAGRTAARRLFATRTQLINLPLLCKTY